MSGEKIRYIVATENEVLLETDYLSKVVFFGELRSSQDEIERTDDEIIAIANHLHEAYIKSKVMINILNFVDAVRYIPTERILNMDIYDIIDRALREDY